MAIWLRHNWPLAQPVHSTPCPLRLLLSSVRDCYCVAAHKNPPPLPSSLSLTYWDWSRSYPPPRRLDLTFLVFPRTRLSSPVSDTISTFRNP